MHGRGCNVYDGEIHIDWDFDAEGYGINPMMLSYYIEQSAPELHNIYNIKKIREEFEKAVNNGELRKKDDLYYLI